MSDAAAEALRTTAATPACSGNAPGPLHRATPVIVLVLLPWAMLAISTDWIYSAAGLIDAWLYHGFFHFFREFAPTNFGITYYSTRLAWILPGYAAYHLLPPFVANLTLHLLFFYAALGALYRSASILSDRSAALIGTCAFATTTPTVVAFGWDYVDGAVITYTLVALWAVIEASLGRRRGGLLFTAGAASACIVHSNLAAVLLCPVIVIAYWFTHARMRWTDVVVFIGGAIVVTGAMGVCSLVGGGHFLFFMPSVRWASTSLGTQTFVPAPPLKWPGSARFVVPLVGLCAALGAFAHHRTPGTRTGLFSLLWLTSAFVAYDWGTSGALLQTQYYVSWFLPLAFLAIAAAMRRISFPVSVALSISLCAVQLTALRLFPNHLHQLLVELYGARVPFLEITAASVALSAAALVAWRAHPVIQAVTVTVALIVADFVAAPNLGYGITTQGRAQFEMVQQSIAFIRGHVARGSRPVFWIQPESPNSVYFNSIASTHLYLYSIASFAYPHFIDDEHKYPTTGASLHRGDYLLILSDTTPDIDVVKKQLARLDFDCRRTASTVVRAEGVTFVLTLLQLTA